MRSRLYLFLLPVFILAESCETKDVQSRLREADTFITCRHPDSALVILRQVDTTRLRTAKGRASFSLLYAIALDKNSIDTTDVRVVMPAVQYYDRHGSSQQQMKSWYYLGRIQSNAGDYSAAIVSFHSALEAAEQTDDIRMKGMIYSQIGWAYNHGHNVKEELQAQLASYKCFAEYGDSSDLNIARYELALAMHNNHLLKEADSLYTILGNKNGFQNISLLCRARNAISKNPDAIFIIECFQQAISNGMKLSTNDKYDYAYALTLADKDKEANTLLRELAQKPKNSRAEWRLFQIEQCRGRFKEALEHLETHTYQTDSIVKLQLAQSMFKALSAHDRASAELVREKATASQRLALILVLMSLLVVLVLGILLKSGREATRRAIDQLARMEEESERLQELAQTKDRQWQNYSSEKKRLLLLQKSFASMYQQQFAEIGKIKEKSPNISDISAFVRQDQIKRIQEILDEISDKPIRHKQFEARVDRELDGILTKLRADFPSYKEKDFRFLSYLIVGFDNTTLSVLLGETPENIRVKRYRTKKRILSSGSSNIDLYAAFIH